MAKMKKNKTYFFIVFTLISLLFSHTAFSESEGLLNKLLAPGPLMEGHKKLEGNDCLKCHEAGKGISESKCLECHKEIKSFVDRKNGFHGLTGQSCIKCHSDHKGREFDTTAVDQKSFDHFKSTGYSLEGKHSTIKCSECHNQKRITKPIRKNDIRFMGAASTCVSCHKKDDIHFFKNDFAKKDCYACHNPTSWKDNIKFEHFKDTGFKLVEKHKELKCNDCHQLKSANSVSNSAKPSMQLAVYKWPKLQQNQCLSCHNSPHVGKLSAKYQASQCTQCHSQTTWTVAKFNHEITGFKLNGKHASINCIDCHKQKEPTNLNSKSKVQAQTTHGSMQFMGLKTACISCHQDVHRFSEAPKLSGKNWSNCTTCHTDQAWKPTPKFNHDTSTRFKIDGEHEVLNCKDCHFPNTTKKSQSTSLIGLKKVTYNWKELPLKTCETCHASPHKNTFSAKLQAQKCTQCHVTSGWAMGINGKSFDHSKTRFQLTDAHAKAKCVDCHGSGSQQKFKFKLVGEKFCSECHTNVHRTQFSQKFSAQTCVECHKTSSFKELLPFDHSKTNYPLKGKHSQLTCVDCHKPTNELRKLEFPNITRKNLALNPPASFARQFVFKDLAANQCKTCHTDIHKGQLPSNCTKCHSENGWKPTSFVHNQHSVFLLRGQHAKLECSQCHKPTTEKLASGTKMLFVVKYKPLPQTCAQCHKDPHKGSFGSNCIDCHTEQTWKSTKDFHKNFNLKGVHFTLSCNECHRNGMKLAGLSDQCLACHKKDDVHNGMLPNCKDCHTQHFWESSKFKHSITRFPLRGAHRTLDCTQCHTNGIYKGLSTSCVTCHLTDFQSHPTEHASQPSNTDCVQCHKNTFSFGK